MASTVGRYIVAGDAPNDAAAAMPQSPREVAERLLQVAREHDKAGDLVSALTDLAVALSAERQCQRARELLEEALPLARQLHDPPKFRDVLGNLGLLLADKDRPRALQLLQEELALGRSSADPIAIKPALRGYPETRLASTSPQFGISLSTGGFLR
jgi:outer membrane PBP1 activator LpoA protein